jgi:hypothetical protein
MSRESDITIITQEDIEEFHDAIDQVRGKSTFEQSIDEYLESMEDEG